MILFPADTFEGYLGDGSSPPEVLSLSIGFFCLYLLMATQVSSLGICVGIDLCPARGFLFTERAPANPPLSHRTYFLMCSSKSTPPQNGQLIDYYYS